MAYGSALRLRVLQFYDAGQKTSVIAERLAVSRSWCRRVKQRRNELPRKSTGRPLKLDKTACERMKQYIVEQPDSTLEELRAWCQSKLQISISTGGLWSTLRRMKLTLKKSR